MVDTAILAAPLSTPGTAVTSARTDFFSTFKNVDELVQGWCGCEGKEGWEAVLCLKEKNLFGLSSHPA